ncbi:hypothetical protein C0991_010372 [Blastosporella zonata]|nr:hypothetical protein C0991_010372 [Blastosporella zonata]
MRIKKLKSPCLVTGTPTPTPRVVPPAGFTRLFDLPSPCPPLSIAYDVSYPPSPHTVIISRTLDDTDGGSKHSKISLSPEMITSTLSEPATVPPTTSQLVLTSPKFSWEVIATSARNTFTGRPNASSASIAIVHHTTNLDVLNAIHMTLATRVTAEEWGILGAREKKRVMRAYEKRCVKADGGWDEGVRRVDYLCGKTMLVGIEFVKDRWAKGGEQAEKGKMIFEL